MASIQITTMRLILLIPTLFTSLIACGQKDGPRTIQGRAFAEKELVRSLSETSLHNLVDGKKDLINDSTTAITIAETVLFKNYGQKQIRDQRPYEIYKMRNWSISGTLPRGTRGGTFLIIINAKDGRIVRITHGK